MFRCHSQYSRLLRFSLDSAPRFNEKMGIRNECHNVAMMFVTPRSHRFGRLYTINHCTLLIIDAEKIEMHAYPLTEVSAEGILNTLKDNNENHQG